MPVSSEHSDYDYVNPQDETLPAEQNGKFLAIVGLGVVAAIVLATLLSFT